MEGRAWQQMGYGGADVRTFGPFFVLWPFFFRGPTLFSIVVAHYYF